jgi:hypothetical protein
LYGQAAATTGLIDSTLRFWVANLSGVRLADKLGPTSNSHLHE